MTPDAKNAFDLFLLSVQEVGLKDTATVLRHNLDKNAWRSHPDAIFVLQMVAQTFQIPVEEIRSGVTRKNDRRDAIGFCAFILHDRLGHPIEQTAWMLNRSAWICYKYAMLITKLNPEKPADRKYLKWRKLFDAKVEDYKKRQPQKLLSHGTSDQPPTGVDANRAGDFRQCALG